MRRRNLLMEACTCAVTPQLEAAAAAAPCNPAGQRCCERCGSDFKVEIVYTGWPLRCVFSMMDLPVDDWLLLPTACCWEIIPDAVGLRLRGACNGMHHGANDAPACATPTPASAVGPFDALIHTLPPCPCSRFAAP